MSIHDILKKYWGFSDFRPLQEDIIESVLNGNDTLGLMPTGGGKSITFQVPGLSYEDGFTIVITPLISLMKDQVDNLKRRKIKAVYFHAGMKTGENRTAWEHIINGKAKFMYIAPERLSNERFMMEIRQLKVNLIVVDEAHCISQWGYDFRPSYLNISKLRKLKPEAPVLALTATATPSVVEDIKKQLKFKENSKIFRKSFVRENLNYIVRKTDSKIHEIIHILSRTSGSSIVYVRSRKKSCEISDILSAADISSTYYHAGLDHELKENRQNAWKNGEIRVMVATNAFGMGIDKPDVRTVIHYEAPPSLEEYYQEAGRAGRDGKESFAVLLISKPDIAIMRRRITEAYPDRKIIKKTYERICNFLHWSLGEGYDKIREFDITHFCKCFGLQEKQCRASLRILAQANYMMMIEDPDSRSRVKMLCTREELYNFKDIGILEEKVLMSIMRLYTGLFSDYIYIRESEIASHLQINKNDIYPSFLELSRKKILSYIPHSGLPMIYLPTAREETSSLIIHKDIYEKRIDSMRYRTESMIDYAFNDNSCRVRRMLSYFGDNEGKDCGKCDICREKRKVKKNTDDIFNKILKIVDLSSSGITLAGIQIQCKVKNDFLNETLSFLCNEGYLRYENDRYFINN